MKTIKFIYTEQCLLQWTKHITTLIVIFFLLSSTMYRQTSDDSLWGFWKEFSLSIMFFSTFSYCVMFYKYKNSPYCLTLSTDGLSYIEKKKDKSIFIPWYDIESLDCRSLLITNSTENISEDITINILTIDGNYFSIPISPINRYDPNNVFALIQKYLLNTQNKRYNQYNITGAILYKKFMMLKTFIFFYIISLLIFFTQYLKPEVLEVLFEVDTEVAVELPLFLTISATSSILIVFMYWLANPSKVALILDPQKGIQDQFLYKCDDYIEWANIINIELVEYNMNLFISIQIKSIDQYLASISLLDRLKINLIKNKQLSPIFITNNLQNYSIVELYDNLKNQWQNSIKNPPKLCPTFEGNTM